jgi:hypothetical protein
MGALTVQLFSDGPTCRHSVAPSFIYPPRFFFPPNYSSTRYSFTPVYEQHAGKCSFCHMSLDNFRSYESGSSLNPLVQNTLTLRWRQLPEETDIMVRCLPPIHVHERNFVEPLDLICCLGRCQLRMWQEIPP